MAAAVAMLPGMPAGDPEEVVGFLMKKFSGLIDRVQAAEEREAAGQQFTVALESRVRAAADRRRTTTTSLQAGLQSKRAEADRAGRRLAEARKGADAVAQELREARGAAASLKSKCEALGVRCQEEHKSLSDAADLAAQGDEAWVACEVEKERLRSETNGLREQLARAEEELVTARELERCRRVDVRALEEKISETGRAWQAAERRAEAQHEEVCGALKTVTLYRERLDSARHALVRREEELAAEDGELDGLQVELQRRDEEVAAAARGLQRLGEVKAQLEAALKENAEAHERVQVAFREKQSCESEGKALAGRRQELEARMASTDSRLAAAAAELGHGGERLRKLREATRRCEERRRALEEAQKGVGPAGEHLQSELQRVFAETEQARAEFEEVGAALEDMQKRLRTAEPALEAARRRAMELKDSFGDAEAEAERARNRKDALMREVGQCREKMRGLRRRHAQLTERSQALEKRLLRSSGAFGGTAGFMAAAAAVSSGPGGAGSAIVPCSSHGDSVRATPSRTPRVPKSRAASAERLPAAPSVPAAWASTPARQQPQPPQPPAEPVVAESLGYLKQWIEMEEARLGVARTPPKPCSVPASPTGRSTPPPRSARAVASLDSGVAGPAEAEGPPEPPVELGGPGSGVPGLPLPTTAALPPL